MKRPNPGKDFENDIKDSSENRGIFCYRLRDPAASFNQADSNLRFSVRNMCDFMMFNSPTLFLIECKSHKGLSIPFTVLKTKEKDNRIKDMAEASFKHEGVEAYVLFNWRDNDNLTVAVRASFVNIFITTEGEDFGKRRKSIPMQWTLDHGGIIDHRLKRVHYDYDLSWLMPSKYNPEVQP